MVEKAFFLVEGTYLLFRKHRVVVRELLHMEYRSAVDHSFSNPKHVLLFFSQFFKVVSFYFLIVSHSSVNKVDFHCLRISHLSHEGSHCDDSATLQR